jgi:hypothetical protein
MSGGGWLGKTCREAAWAPLLVLGLFAILVSIFHAYRVYPWIDMPTHFAAGMAAAYFFASAARHAQQSIGAIPKLIQRLLALGLTTMLAVAWEFLEFLSDTFLGTHMNHGVADTLHDLFFGMLGAAVVLAAMRRD